MYSQPLADQARRAESPHPQHATAHTPRMRQLRDVTDAPAGLPSTATMPSPATATTPRAIDLARPNLIAIPQAMPTMRLTGKSK